MHRYNASFKWKKKMIDTEAEITTNTRKRMDMDRDG